MSVIAFPNRKARISPQLDGDRVAVNVTAIDCEGVRDMFKRARIRVLERVITVATLADDMAAARRAQADLGGLKASLLRASKAPCEVA